MTTQEFSDQFDVLWNNISSNQAPGLNEYEKSIFLTKAQNQLVLEYFNRRTDGVGGGFDGSKQRQYDFSGLIRTEELYNVNTYANRISGGEKLDRRSLVFLLPWNYFLSVNEILYDDVRQYSVLPIDFSEYQRLMLKPYNYPVKRGAWMLITDKKNCNFWREYVGTGETLDDETTPVYTQTDYMFTSSWADEKRNLSITIERAQESGYSFEGGGTIPRMVPDVVHSTTSKTKYRLVYYSTVRGSDDHVGEDTYAILKEGKKYYVRNMTIVNRGWAASKLTYEVEIEVDPYVSDDHDAFESIKDGFKGLKELLEKNNIDIGSYDEGIYEDFVKACRHTDGFAMASAPSKFEKIGEQYGLQITTEHKRIPFAEIIGKFTGEPHYQMRYVRTLEPIILEDLTNYGNNLTIDGISQRTECVLPSECHQELLERAVTLAKIAWQGGTLTQARAAAENNRS